MALYDRIERLRQLDPQPAALLDLSTPLHRHRSTGMESGRPFRTRTSGPGWPRWTALPLLIDLVYEGHELQVSAWRPVIREIIVEHLELDEAADAVCHDAEQLEQCVELIEAELKKARRERLRRGHWSEAPVTPLMFG